MTSKFEETNRCKCSIDININGINYVSKKDYEILKEKLNGILKKELFQESESTPEIMKAEPKFKVGDKVVAPLSTEDIMTVDEVKYNHSMGVYMYPVKEKSITYTETSLEPVNVCYMKPEGEVCDWKDGKCRHSKTITRHDLCGFRDKPESNNPEIIKGYRRTALSSEEFLEIYPEEKPQENEIEYKVGDFVKLTNNSTGFEIGRIFRITAKVRGTKPQVYEMVDVYDIHIKLILDDRDFKLHIKGNEFSLQSDYGHFEIGTSKRLKLSDILEVNEKPEMLCPKCGLKIKKKYLNMKKGYPETIILCGCSFWKLVTEYKKISDIDK